MAKWVAVKCRISDDTEGRGDGVADQERWGRAYAAEHWPDLPVEVYVDNDISAADRRTRRQDFERFCGDVQAGLVAHVVCTNRNRITRDLVQWIDMVDDLFIPAGIEEIHTRHRGIQRVDDLATDMDAVLGRREVRTTRRLVLDGTQRLFEAGRPSGSRSTGYVMARNGDGELTLEIVPAEADNVCWAAEAVLRGWGLLAIGREWTQRNMPRARGGKKAWASSSVATVLRSPTVAGWRVTRRGGQERKVRGNWRPILATMLYECPQGCELRVSYHDDLPDTCESHGLAMAENQGRLDDSLWREVCHRINTRPTAVGSDGKEHKVGRGTRRARPRRYLLTGGMAVCGHEECEAPLVAGQKRFKKWRNGEPIPFYTCVVCGKIAIVGDPFEKHVEKTFLAKLGESDFRAELERDDGYVERRREITEALRQLEADEADLGRTWAQRRRQGKSTITQEAAQDELDAQRDALTAALAAVPMETPQLDLDAVIEDWGDATLDEKRHILGLYMDRVVVLPGLPGRLNEERLARRVEIRWRR